MKITKASLYYHGARIDIPEYEHRVFPTITGGEIDLNLSVYLVRNAMEKMAGGVAIFVERVEWERGQRLAVHGNGWEVIYEGEAPLASVVQAR